MGAIVRNHGEIVAKDVIAKHSVDLACVYQVALRRSIEHLAFCKDDKMSYFDSFCLILSESEYDQIQQVLERTKEKIIGIARNKSVKKFIAYYNSNLFFASKPPKTPLIF